MVKYDKYFFTDFYEKNGGGDYTKREQWWPFFAGIAKKIVEVWNPRTVLDAGCACGYLVEALRCEGVDAYGFDISEFAIEAINPAIKQYCFVHNITEELPRNVPQRYDLVITIEVLEHLYENDGVKAIGNLCKYSDRIVFSSTPDDITDQTHVNVRISDYWCRIFASNSFFKDLMQPVDWLSPWAMVFEKREDIANVIDEYERKLRISIENQKLEINQMEIRLQENEEKSKNIENASNLYKLQRDEKEAIIKSKIETIEQQKENLDYLEQELKEIRERLKKQIQTVEELQKRDEKNHRLVSMCQGNVRYISALLEDTQGNMELSRMQEKAEFETRLSAEKIETQMYREKYEAMINSTAWKASKPVRAFADILKSKRNFHVVRKAKKICILGTKCLNPQKIKTAVKYVQKNGLVETAHITNAILTNEVDNFGKKVLPAIQGDIQFSVVMPVYNVNIRWLEKAIDSVKRQSYENWQLCIVDDASTYLETLNYLKRINDPRILVYFSEKNQGISGATNDALNLASGDYVVLLDNDDELSPDALESCYLKIKESQAEIIYSDQDIIFENGEHGNPLYKPDWSPDLFLCQMYLGHLICLKKELVQKVGGFNSTYNGSQDYDLLLRMLEKNPDVAHVSKVLYSWRALESSTASNPESKPYAQIAGLNAIQAHMNRLYGENYATVVETDDFYIYDVRYHTLHEQLVSIIIPTKDHIDDLEVAISSIIENSNYTNYEIIILDNRSEKEETFKYFSNLEHKHDFIRIVKADCEFNWSKINNIGIREAKGDVLVFLNNDVKVISKDWLNRLAENALRDDIGVVGPMLLYEDDTIQHAGVVIGFGGFADHVFKGMKPIHWGSPFVSPCVTRNVSAVTGACMVVERKKLDKVGIFDENYEVCGSDVELCLRFLEKGYNNIYTPFVKLYHYESKSRGNLVPENDIILSQYLYADILEKGDKYYNKNLSYERCQPTVANVSEQVVDDNPGIEMSSAEITPIHFRKVEYSRRRLNILLPSLNREHVFGGIATALRFFEELQRKTGFDARIVLVDREPDITAIKDYSYKYQFCDCNEDIEFEKQIVPFADRKNKTLPVSDKDFFLFTGWWTAYCIQDEYQINAERLGLHQNPFLYLIQDYEPGFYPWSSQYVLADLTYRTKQKQIAVFNSRELQDFFLKREYKFDEFYCFDPILNEGLKKKLPKQGEMIFKKKQVLVYGRPSTARNAFFLLIEALKRWVSMQNDIEEWDIYAAGESFQDINLGKGKKLRSLGKLSIEKYSEVLRETYAGISLMVSPHPSYPPLEMSVYDIEVVTNSFENKNLEYFNKNIHSLEVASPVNIANELRIICDNYTKSKKHCIENSEYCKSMEVFPCIDMLVKHVYQ